MDQQGDSNYQSHNHNTSKHQISPGIGIELNKVNGLNVGVNYNGEFSRHYRNHEALLQISK